MGRRPQRRTVVGAMTATDRRYRQLKDWLELLMAEGLDRRRALDVLQRTVQSGITDRLERAQQLNLTDRLALSRLLNEDPQ